MKITHNISISTTTEIRRELETIGITVGEGFVSFKIEESDERWIKLKPKILEWHAIDMPDTTFSEKELSESEWLEMLPEWHHGYPQPEKDFKYLHSTYNLSNYCSKCGIGAVQKDSFRMQKEPKWGKRGILQLNWVFDQYFVLPDVWRDIFKVFDISCLPVIHHRTGKNLSSVLQLSNLENTELENIDSYPYEICSKCGRKKYLPISIGRFPKLKMIPKSHIVRTKEHFGSGGSAFNEVIVSQDLYKQIRKYNLKGVSFNATY